MQLYRILAILYVLFHIGLSSLCFIFEKTVWNEKVYYLYFYNCHFTIDF